DLPGAAVSYVAHSATRVAQIIDGLAERGEKVVSRTGAVTEEIEAGTKATARQAKVSAGETKKTAQAAAKKAGSTARSCSMSARPDRPGRSFPAGLAPAHRLRPFT